MRVLRCSIDNEAYTSVLSGSTGHPAEVLHCFFLKDIFENVDNENIINFIKGANFYSQL